MHFVDMELNVLPYAIAWIAKDGTTNGEGKHVGGLPLLQQFLRSVSGSLFTYDA